MSHKSTQATSLQGQKNKFLPPIQGGILRKYSKDLNTIQKFSDSAVAFLSFFCVSVIIGRPWGQLEQTIGVFSSLLVVIYAGRLHLYTSFRDISHWSLLRRVFILWLSLVGTISLGLFIFKVGSQISRLQVGAWFIIYGSYLCGSHIASRQLLRQLRLRGRNTRFDGYIGSENGLHAIKKEYSASIWLGHRVEPILCWDDKNPSFSQEDVNTLVKVIEATCPDRWILEEPNDNKLLNTILSCLKEQTSPILLIPRWIEGTYFEPRFRKLGTLAALELWGHSENATPLQLMIKNITDRAASLVILVLISPLLAIISIAILLDTGRPIVFKQTRYGLNGKPFQCLKFRSMHCLENGGRVVQAKRYDSRVTRIGSVLRSWNLDELPQLINILRGEMSLVGPRPHAAAHNDYYRTLIRSYTIRHSLKPGLTGYAQIKGLRGETETIEKMEARVEADIEYIQNWSLKLDLKIILLTFLNWRSKDVY